MENKLSGKQTKRLLLTWICRYGSNNITSIFSFMLLCHGALLLIASSPALAQMNHKSSADIKREIDSMNRATDRRLDSTRKAVTQHADSMESAFQQDAAIKRDQYNEEVARQIKQKHGRYYEEQERREEKSWAQYKWIAVIGRYVIIFGILLLIGWWKNRHDKKKQTTETTEKSPE